MAIEKLFQDNFEFFTLEANPARTFSSSSSGVTGTIRLFPRASSIEKEVQPLSLFSASLYNDSNLDDLRRIAVNNTSSDISANVSSYLAGVNEQQVSARKLQTLEVIRFTPTFNFSSNTLRKNVVRSILMPFYRTPYPRGHFNYSNYHCLNFFTGSSVPSDSALLYPNSSGSVTGDEEGGLYQISGAFSFDFWIKPNYTTDAIGLDYKPGSIMHLTGAYALTLHSGSSKDLQGKPDRFRIALALSDSANVPPSLQTSGPLTFFSTDNSLYRDSWNHVTVRWGGTNFNFGSGSIVVNNRIDTNFVITESLTVGRLDASASNPTVLVVGNYYEGQNFGITALDRFFARDPAKREGLVELLTTTAVEQPTSASFTHPLNAEIHELKLLEKYLTTTEIERLDTAGITSLNRVQFYLPPFFTEESPYRQFVGTRGGVLVTPFFERDGSTNDPFAIRMAFGAGGHYINLENYVKDFGSGNYPRLWNLTGSSFTPGSTAILSANDFLYATGSVRKRLYTILPCDNGDVLPNFDLLAAFTGSTKFVDDFGNRELGVIDLNNLVDETDFPSRAVTTSGSILDDILGARPEALDAVPGDSLAILHRTRDGSSNQIVFFDVSNIFYGNRIKPGTVTLSDSGLSGSGDKVSITIKDDGNGNLYRANASGSNPTWASLGNVFYDEGVLILKHPQLFFFGENQYEISFQGEQNIHVLTINAFAKALTQTSSSSPAFDPTIQLRDINEDLANEPDQKFVYITGINIHDDNLNVIARTNIAQPIVKKSGDKFLFKVKLDF
jgi:hypothetical protein